MKKVCFKLIMLFAILLFVSCKSKPEFDITEFKNRAERKVNTYQVSKELAIEDKIMSPPKEIIAYINKMDSTDKYTSYKFFRIHLLLQNFSFQFHSMWFLKYPFVQIIQAY